MIWTIFRKDGLEILRDRRTLFVNLVLPVLLYPVLILFMVQVLQLTQAAPGAAPRIALIDAPGALRRLMQDPVTHPAKPVRPTAAVAMTAKPLHVELADLSAADGARLARLVETLPADAVDRPPEILALLRRNHLAVAVVHRELPDGRHRLSVLLDDAHPRTDEVGARVRTAVDAWRGELIVERLRQAGLPADTTQPVESAALSLAPAADSLRTRIAGMIPLLLVILAATGAFYPALDLIAGERERGTLETLLSLPVRRRDVFVGKLLVTCGAAAAAVILNLLSLAFSIGMLGSQMPSAGGGGPDLAGMFATGGGTLLLCFVVLLPLTITLAAIALAVTGLADSAKEAQNYISPLLLVVLIAASVAAIPGTRPNMALDLVPITGVVLALKEALQSPTLPWLHLSLATGASLAVAVVIVAWSSRLLESERFRYPGLVRAGWGRWRRWGVAPDAPGGLEVLGVYAVAVAGMTLGSGLFANAHPALLVAGPLLAFVAMPALIHAWLGAYSPAAINLRLPDGRGWLAAILILPLALCLSAGIGGVQQALVPRETLEQGTGQVEQVIRDLRAQGGVGLLLLCVAFIPGICEELLCRGTLLAGLRRGIGPVGAAAASAFLFAALHLSPWRFAPQFVLGLLLAVLVWRTRSLLPAMLVHAGHNAVLVLLELYGTKDVPSPTWLALFAIATALSASAAWRITKRE